jgi:hypothetical protein
MSWIGIAFGEWLAAALALVERDTPACAPRPRPRPESADRPSVPAVWSDRTPHRCDHSLTEYPRELAESSAQLFTSLKEIVRSNVRVRNVADMNSP